MRVENHTWDAIRVIMDTGSLATVTAIIRRRIDGFYLQSAGGWQLVVDTVSLTELSVPNLPGLFSFTIPLADSLLADADDGYDVQLTSDFGPTTESVHLITRDSANAFRDLAFRSRNVRIVYTSFNSNGQATAGTVYLYFDKTTLDADVSPFPNALESYPWTSTYDTEFKLTEHTQTEST